MMAAILLNAAAMVLVVGGWAVAVAHVYRALGRDGQSHGPPQDGRDPGWRPADGPPELGRGVLGGPRQSRAGRAAHLPVARAGAHGGVRREREGSVA